MAEKKKPNIGIKRTVVSPITEASTLHTAGFAAVLPPLHEEPAAPQPESVTQKAAKSGNVRVSFFITGSCKEKVERAAKREAVPQSYIVEAALDEYFEKYPELISEAQVEKEDKWAKIKSRRNR